MTTRVELSEAARTRAVRILVAGSFLNAVAFFSAAPFLTLYLDRHSDLSLPVIGAVVGSVALVAAVGGFFGGVIVDRTGAVRWILVGLAIYVAVYAGLAVVAQTWAIVSLIMLIGVGRLFVEPAMKKLLSLASGEGGGLFRVRYITLCLGAIVGPAIGGLLYLAGPVYLFSVPCALLLAYAGLVLWQSKTLKALEVGTQSVDGGMGRISEVARDRGLILAIGAGLVIFFVFSQIDSIVPVFINREEGTAGVGYFSALLIANAVLAILLQGPIEWASKRMSRGALVLTGCAAFAAGLALFAALPIHPAMLFAGIFFWTVGEAILLPMPDIAIHQLADESRRGAYFGLGELRYLGFFLGPVAGGVLLGTGAIIYFGVMAAAIFICVPLLAGATSKQRAPESLEPAASVA